MKMYKLIVLLLTIFSCSTEITPSNPFDPASPKTIQARGEIVGSIFPEDYNDLQKATFTVTLKDTSYNAIVEKNGYFTIKDVEKGNYYLRVISSDSAYYETEFGPLTVSPGQKTNAGAINLLFKKGIVRGFVKKTDESNKFQIGVGNARVSLVSSFSKTGFLMTAITDACDKNKEKNYYTQISDSDGSFEFGNVKVGSYNLSSFDDINGIGFLNDSVVVKENQPVDVGVINLVPPSALIQIEDENNPGKVISVTKNNRVKAVFFYGDFLKELKLSVNSPVDNADWEDLNQNRYKLIDLSSEGNYTINIRFRDILCRETPVYSARLFLDKTPPNLNRINLEDTNEGYINKDNLKINILVSDNYSDYRLLMMRKITVDESEIPSGNIDSIFFESRQIAYGNFAGEFVEPISGNSGKKVFLIQFKDEAGNDSDVYRKDFYFENKAPEIEVKIDGAKNISGTDTINSSYVNLKVVDTATNKVAPLDRIKVFYSNENEPEQWDIYREVYPVMLPIKNGYIDINVRVMDKAKNISNIVTKRIMVDTQPPQITSIRINGDSKHTNNQTVKIEISGHDINEMIVSNNFDFGGASWTTYSPIINSFDVGSIEGIHNIYFKFRDTAGNETDTFIREIILDTTPPCAPENISISNSRYSTKKNKYFTNVSTPLFSWQYNCPDYSEIERFKIEIKKGEDILFSDYTYSNNIVVPYIKDGDYQVRFYSIDKAGNMSLLSHQEINFVIDTISPTTPRIKKMEYAKMKLPEYKYTCSLAYIDIDISVMPIDENITDFKFQISGGYDKDCFSIHQFKDISSLEGQLIDKDTVRFYVAKNNITTLMIRGVDEAENYSDIDFVTVVEDSMEPIYVQNIRGETGDSKILVSWEPPARTPDVDGYLIYYGYQYYNLSGNFANEGSSPINVKKPCTIKDGKEVCQFWLTGVPNGTPFFIDVAAYDDTKPQPNVGSITYGNIMVVAGVVSPDLIKEIGLLDINAELGSTFEAVEERDGLVYLTTGNENGNGGLHIVDVSTPSSPTLVGHIKHPNFKTMHQIKLFGRYAFVANGENGVVIFDTSKPDDIKIVKQISVAPNTFAVGLENNENYLYIITNSPVADNQDSTLLIYNILDISNPQLAKVETVPIKNIQSVAIQGNYLYLGSPYMFRYLDVSNINNIVPKYLHTLAIGTEVSSDLLYTIQHTNLSIYKYETDTYKQIANVSLNDIGLNVLSDGPYIYVSTNYGLKILRNHGNFDFLAAIKYINMGHLRHFSYNKYWYITHKNIKVSKTLLFATYFDPDSNTTGLKIFSLANPRNPKKVSDYRPDELFNRDVSLYKDMILITHYNSLELGRHANDFAVNKQTTEQLNTSLKYTDYYDGRLFTTAYDRVVLYDFNINQVSKRVYTITNPSNREIISATVRDNYLFIGIDNNFADTYRCIEEIQVVDIRNMSLKNSTSVGNCSSKTLYYEQSRALTIYSNYLYVAVPDNGILIYDISNIESPVFKSKYVDNYARMVGEISVYGKYLYYSSKDYFGGLMRLYLGDPLNPEFKNLRSASALITRIIPSGDFIYSGTQESLISFDFSNNNYFPYSIYHYNTFKVYPATTGNIAYLSNFNRGIMVLKLE